MFSQNDRISARQFKRLLILELFGVTTVLLPGILCETVQEDGVLALFAGMVLVLIYSLLLKNVARRAGRSLQKTLKEKSRILYEIFLFIMLIQMVLMGIWVLTIAAEMSRDILLQGMDIRLVMLTFVFVSIVGAWKGMECRGRMAEVLYFILLIPFVVLLILAARKVNMDEMLPISIKKPEAIAHGSYEVFIVFQGVTLGFFALPYLKHQKTFYAGIRKSVLLNALFCFALMIIAIGIFGIQGAASQKWLAINLMTTTEFPGAIVERLDVLMVSIWIAALFFFVSGSIFYGGKMAGRLLNMKHEKTGLIVVAVLVAGGSLFAGERDYAYFVYMNYMKYIGVPLLLLLLLIILCRLHPRKTAGVVAGLFLAVLLTVGLTGCAKGVELEDRQFVLTLGIDWDGEHVICYYDTNNYADSKEDSSGQNVVRIETEHFYDWQSAYGQQSDKYLDYNHLKSMILGKGLVSNREKLIEFLQYIEKNELFARNVKLFFAEDIESIFKLCPNMETVLGEYLENIYVDSNYYVNGQSRTLGDLLKHWHDEEETLLVPAVHAVEKHPMIESYAVVHSVQWVDQMQENEANLFFIGNGVNVQTQVTVDKEYAVQPEQVKREIQYTDGEPVEAELTITIRGKIINEEIEQEKLKRKIEQKLEKQLEQAYASAVSEWKGLDPLHLYQALGSRNRSLWEKFRNRRAEFNDQLKVTVHVQAYIM